MSNVRKRQNCLSCPGSESKATRKRSIYSKGGAANSCNYLGQNICGYLSTTLDDPYEPTMRNKNRFNLGCKAIKMRNRSDVEADSVGSAVGLACSNNPIIRPCKCLEEELHDLTFAQDFATYLKAFALIYVLPEEEWKAENIDKLLLEGEELFHNSSEEDQADGLQHQSTIYSKIEQRIKRNFKLEGHNFTVELKSPYVGDTRKPVEQRPKHIIKNLKLVLQGFFRTAHYCLFLYKAGYLLIWRRRKMYFVMDVKGRRRNDLVSARNGVAMLVCLQTIDNAVHLISNLSGISPKVEFSIRELAVVRLVTPDGRVFHRDSNQRSVEYSVINKNYAYLKSSLHLSLNPADTLRNISSVLVGMAAIIASKIDHPASWNTNMFNRLMCYGVELCRSCWGACVQDRLPIDLDRFPTQLRLGQFVVELKLLPEVHIGQWNRGVGFQGSDFEHEIRQALMDYGNALFQINQQMYALWHKDNFYYLLDPYRHTVVGPQAKEDGTLGAKWATVRMFRDLLTMLSVFHQLLMESNRHSTFFIHVVCIRNIAECPQGYALKPMPVDVDYEVQPLNETIVFPDQLNKCEQLLADISDLEPNVLSDAAELCVLENFELIDDKDSKEWEGGDEEESDLEEMETAKPIKSKITTKSKSLTRTKVNKQALKESTESKTPADGKSTKTAEKLVGPSKKVASSTTTTTRKKENPLSAKAKNNLVDPRTPARSANIKGFGLSTAARKDLNLFPQAGGSPDALRMAPTDNAMVSNCKTDFGQRPTKVGQFKLESEKRCPCQGQRPIVNAKVSKCNCKSDFVQRPTNIGHFKLESEKRSPCLSQRQSQRQANRKCNAVSQTSTDRIADVPINYPVYTKYPHKLAIAGSESGTMESLHRLLNSAFRVTNRVLTMTPWGNYVVFRHPVNDSKLNNPYWFYLFDGCTCNIDRFRHLDLTYGTAGLLPFQSQAQVVCYMIDSRETKALKMLRNRLSEPGQRHDNCFGRGA